MALRTAPAPDASVYSPPPSLIHIIHPYALDNLIGAISHLNTFRAYLDTLLPSKLKAGIAKEVVLDLIDCSGIDFKELESALNKINQLDEFIKLDGALFVITETDFKHRIGQLPHCDGAFVCYHPFLQQRVCWWRPVILSHLQLQYPNPGCL
jgi:hypothetical protein